MPEARNARLATVLAPILLLARCDSFSRASEQSEDACTRYAEQFEALMKIEAKDTMLALGGEVRPEDLLWSPANITRASREVEPRCSALPKEERGCVEKLVPVVAEFLDARAACDDHACRRSADEAAQAELSMTDECRDVVLGLNCVMSKDCKE